MKTYLHTPDQIWRSYKFDHVTVKSSDAPEFCFIVPCYSRYSSGPNLCELADNAALLTGVNGHYGYKSPSEETV